MYIKQIIIEGFKSYKDQTISEPFNPRINVVVGANGSGKSNFFHAIRFVLNDIFTTLRAEERQKLLHEGAGHAVMSAYVEMVFDNSNGRLPVDKDEVRLRRTIGLKKDEYHLDKKHITKAEVMNLLETAGFSRANPYYVVQQGKITAMSTMKDHERLALLKEIGGTKVYEERRKESLKILQETDRRRQRIAEVMDSLNQKLAELDEERTELAEYQQLDKQRRSLEYTIYDKELSDVRKKLDQIERERQQAGEKSAKIQEEVQDAKGKLRKVEKELKLLKEREAELMAGQNAKRTDKQAAVQKQAQVELDVKELEDRLKSQNKQKDKCHKDLQKLATEIASKEQQLAEAKLQLEQQEQQEAAMNKKIAEKERRLQTLYQKQGRSSQFTSEAERDEWISKEINQLQDTISKKHGVMATLQEQIAGLNTQAMEISQAIGDQQSHIRSKDAEIEQCNQEIQELKKRKDDFMNARKEAWQQESELEGEKRRLKEEQNKRQRAVERAVPREINRAMNSVKRIVNQHNISGVYGLLFELFEVIPQLHTAVEVTAGNSLFQLVVENDEVSTRIINILNKEKSGRATFLPLNRLSPHDVQYPTQWGSDVLPLVKKLKYNPKLDAAMRQVFGKTLVCRDLELASTVSRQTNLNCVTPDGDQHNKKGILTGGFVDANRSKLDAMKGLREHAEMMQQVDTQMRQHKAAGLEADQQVSIIMGEMEKLEAKRDHLRNGLQPLRFELRDLEVHEELCRQQLSSKERQLQDIDESIEVLQQQIQGHQKELGTPLQTQLTPAERAELAALNPELQQLKESLVSVRGGGVDIVSRKEALEALLANNLKKSRMAVEDSLAALDPTAVRTSLEAKKLELEQVQQLLASLSAQELESSRELESLSQRVNELRSEADRMKQLEGMEQNMVQDEAKALETLMSKLVQLQQKKSDYEKKIRELGSLPADAFEKYRDKSIKNLHSLLASVNTQIKAFGNVNQKALEQYNNFLEQKEDLAKRQVDNDRSVDKINQLIATLDMRKDEAIERTFKGVAKHFRDVFAELAPGGKGELIMQRRAAQEAEEAAEEGVQDNPLERYSGVKVKVSFGAGDVMSMKTLSGGQKTLVALALIFAIQRCDPAPFYLFDEIDAALDPQYRTTVAKMLAKQAHDTSMPAQFIVTTFHQQIVLVADKIYGVSHSNRISRIDVITQEDALEFLQSEENRQQDQAPTQAA